MIMSFNINSSKTDIAYLVNYFEVFVVLLKNMTNPKFLLDFSIQNLTFILPVVIFTDDFSREKHVLFNDALEGRTEYFFDGL